MCNRKRNPKETEKFSMAGLCKRMVLPGVICGVIGLVIPGISPLLLAAIGALLGAIRYCGRFDEPP